MFSKSDGGSKTRARKNRGYFKNLFKNMNSPRPVTRPHVFLYLLREAYLRSRVGDMDFHFEYSTLSMCNIFLYQKANYKDKKVPEGYLLVSCSHSK